MTIGHLVPAKGTSTGQVNGIGVYNTLASDNRGGFGPNPVGYYSRVTAGVAGATIWGANFKIADDYGGTSYLTTEFGQENDCNVSLPGRVGCLTSEVDHSQTIIGACAAQHRVDVIFDGLLGEI